MSVKVVDELDCILLWKVDGAFLVTKLNYARMVDGMGDVYCCARLMGPF